MQIGRRSLIKGFVGYGALCLLSTPAFGTTRGQPTIYAHGGGNFNDRNARDLLRLAGGRSAKVLISPYSMGDFASAVRSEIQFIRSLGFRNVEVMPLDSTAKDMVLKADLVWFSGGSQKNQVLRISAVRGLKQALQTAHRHGVVMAGSSAGAAVMSKLMISGGTNGNAYTRAGLGFWPEVVLDQHVNTRQRQYRLRKVISSNRSLIGIGLYEGTSVSLVGNTVKINNGSAILVRWINGAIREERLRRGASFEQ